MSIPRVRVDTGAFEMNPVHYDGRVSALCLHGLTGTPYEMRPIAEALVRHGIRCVGPILAGHGRTREDLARTHYRDWIERARIALARLRTDSEQVFISGFSMGGLVTLALAEENLPDAIAVLATPLRLGLPTRWVIPLAKRVMPFRKNSRGPDIRDPEARARHPFLDSISLASVHEIIKMQRIVRRGLPKITMPIFVGHGVLDRTANPRDARTIFGEVNASERVLHLGARSGHVISVDHDGPAIASAIAAFFDRQVANRA